MQLKEGNSWKVRIWKSHQATASWMKPWIKYSPGLFNPIWSIVCNFYPDVPPGSKCTTAGLAPASRSIAFPLFAKKGIQEEGGSPSGGLGANKCKNKNMELTFRSISSSTRELSCFANFFHFPPLWKTQNMKQIKGRKVKTAPEPWIHQPFLSDFHQISNYREQKIKTKQKIKIKKKKKTFQGFEIQN